MYLRCILKPRAQACSAGTVRLLQPAAIDSHSLNVGSCLRHLGEKKKRKKKVWFPQDVQLFFFFFFAFLLFLVARATSGWKPRSHRRCNLFFTVLFLYYRSSVGERASPPGSTHMLHELICSINFIYPLLRASDAGMCGSDDRGGGGVCNGGWGWRGWGWGWGGGERTIMSHIM